MTPRTPPSRSTRARRVGRTAGSATVAVAWIACAVATAAHLASGASWPDPGLSLDSGLSPTLSGWLTRAALVTARSAARLLG